ncbi:MAG: hypothetical protein Q7R83_02760 [bacterium]|nr:hypothetical protein [bacterium]
MQIKLVNAAKIRNTIDTDFSSVGSYVEYPYIPRGEMWIDRYLKAERPLFLSLAKLERSMKGKPFRLIRERAQKTMTVPGSLPSAVKIEKQGGLDVRYLDGRAVRKHLDPYFLLGGHALVYSYIPPGQVWIDIHQDPKEQKFTLVHEIKEYELMKRGMSYDDAHDYALAEERAARRKDGVADFIRG